MEKIQKIQIPALPPPPPLPAEKHRIESFWKRLKPMPALAAKQFLDWCHDDGYWYLASMAFHSLGLVALAMITLSISHATFTPAQEKPPSFDAAEEDQAQPIETVRFEVGKPPLDPTELNAETLAEFKALPIKGQTEKFYDPSSEFVEAGGGMATDMKGPMLGGLGGFSIKGIDGPGGRGGVGVGVGLGKNPGSGGDATGFGQRGKGHRPEILGPPGGTRAGERAVGAALNWLNRHQTAQGKWSLDFRHQCKGEACSGPGNEVSDSAATALALLPFLAGQTHKSKGPYRESIAKGIAWLIKQQRMDGDLSGGWAKPLYAHGLATIVLCEDYGMTKDEHVGTAARAAIGFIQRAQNSSTGGWRYQPGDAGDTSVFGWQIMALKSALLAGLPVDSAVLDNSQKWLRSVAKGEHLGLYSYQPYQQVTPTLTAVGMLSRQYLGVDPKSPEMREGKNALLENLPDNTVGRNTYYWYYATQAMHNFCDADWDIWNRKMRRVLIDSQEKDTAGCATGSWDPAHPTADAWGQNGGRLMTTSLSALILEVYYRYLPLFQTDSFVPGRKNNMGFPEPMDAKKGE